MTNPRERATVESDDFERVKGGFRTRLRFGKGQRRRFVIRLDDEDAARARKGKLVELAAMLTAAGRTTEAPIILRKGAAVTSDKDFAEVVRIASDLCGDVGRAKTFRASMTFRQLAEQWNEGALSTMYPDHVATKRSVEDDKYRLKKLYALRVSNEPTVTKLGDMPIARISLEHAEAAMRGLPSTLAAASRRHYAQLISRVLGLACYPLKIIRSSPLPRGWLPKVTTKKAKACIYPKEEARVLACVSLEIEYRIFYGFLAREGLRAGEAVSMRIRDVNVEHGAITLDENKTNDPRVWAMDPAVKRALTIWVERFRKDAPPDALLFVDPDGDALQVDGLAALYRRQLEHVVKLERRELFDRTPTRLPIRAHDLRGAFITYALAAGRSEAWVADRTGHTTSAMINRYRRAARSAKELRLGNLVPLDQAIPEFATIQDQGGGPRVGQNDEEELTAPDEKDNEDVYFGLVAQSVELRTFNP